MSSDQGGLAVVVTVDLHHHVEQHKGFHVRELPQGQVSWLEHHVELGLASWAVLMELAEQVAQVR